MDDRHRLNVSYADAVTDIDGHWPACEHPERPPDELTIFLASCRACEIALDAATRIDPTGRPIFDWYRARNEIAAARAAHPHLTICWNPAWKTTVAPSAMVS